MATKKVAPAKNKPRASPAKTTKTVGVASDATREHVNVARTRGYPYYVYVLADDSGIFYVGKGQGSRYLQHGKRHDRSNAFKLRRIAEAGSSLRRQVVAFARTERAAIDIERQLIGEYRGTLTNIASGGTHQDPKERARARAAEMLARAIPLEQYRKPARVPLSDDEARAMYARILEILRQEVEEPSPTSIEVDRWGRVVRYGYEEVHS